MSQAPTREPVYLKDYRPPAFLTPEVELDFILDPEATVVVARQQFRRNPDAAGPANELALFGENLDLLALAMDGEPLPAERYRLESDRLVLLDPPPAFTLEIKTRINPKANTT